MAASSLSLILILALSAVVSALQGRTYTSWDCCKPACGDSRYIQRAGSSGIVQTCNRSNSPLSNPGSVPSGCDNGQGHLCDFFQPIPMAEDLSYGFAVAPGNNCCKCYDLLWTNGYAAGKRMILQVINWMPDAAANTTNPGRTGDFAILTPGGGSGPNPSGCTRQYGATWGQANGGVDDGTDCMGLPSNLQGGCYWRWNWAGGEMNGWNVEYKQIACPSRLTDLSKCTPAAI